MSTLLYICTLLLSLWSFTKGQQDWCEPIELPSTFPFVVAQPTWWNEYFFYNATYNTTGHFKVYTGMETVSHIAFMINQDSCPYFYKNLSVYTGSSYGTAELSVEMEEGSLYYIFVHVSGANFSLIGCEGPCQQYCPNDCTNFNGICNLAHGVCECRSGWAGHDCSTSAANQTIPHKQPFGSWPLFYAIVAGLPAFVVVAIVFLVVSCITVRNQRHAQSFKHFNKKKINAEEHESLLSPGSLASLSPSPPSHRPAPPLL